MENNSELKTKIIDELRKAVELEASDIFVVAGLPLSFKIKGEISPFRSENIMPQTSENIIRELYGLAGRDINGFLETGDDDFSLSVAGLSRFRVCTYRQRGSMAAIIRVVNFEIPDYSTLNIPNEVISTARTATKGLILVTGPAGSGKSTTLACMIDEINHTRNGHIITLEDPIEFVHRNAKCVVSQREIHMDTSDYLTALRASLRQSPDVILVGEMRDYETIRFVMTAAETGHLVISTLHTVGAVNTIDRIIDVFPANQQPQIRVQLSMLLNTVVSQQLLPTVKNTIVPAFEIMHINGAIRNLIRDSKIHQIDTVITSAQKEGMVTMDASITELYKKKLITSETALLYASNREIMEKRLTVSG